MAGQEPAAPTPAHDRSEGQVLQELGRQAFDKSQSAPRSGSVGLVLLVALALVGAAAGLIYVGRDYAETYILALLAVLGTIGVFALFAMASGIMRLPARDHGNPLLKAVVDNAFDGILVTDQSGRVFYANATYLDLIGATDNNDVRPIERVFIGDPDVSESIYRLLKAAREGRRLQEEVRIAGAAGEPGRWLRMRVRPLGDGKRDARMTVWSIADVTRDRERQENVFQELQHAIDYLDHAPAGFFSVDADGDIVYLNATLAELARSRSRPGRRRFAQAHRYRRRRRRRAAHHAQCRAGRSENRGARPRSQDPRRQAGAGAPVPQSGVRRRRRAGRLAHAGAQSRPGTTAPIRSARRKCASCASSRTRRWRLPPSTRPAASRAAMRASPPPSRACSRATSARS